MWLKNIFRFGRRSKIKKPTSTVDEIKVDTEQDYTIKEDIISESESINNESVNNEALYIIDTEEMTENREESINEDKTDGPATGNLEEDNKDLVKDSVETGSIQTNQSESFAQKGEIKTIGRVIAVANQKGGVGKSTTAINMSSYLGELGYKTLLIDFDPQSNSTSGLGIEKDSIEKSIYDVLILGEDLNNTMVETTYKNLYLIPSTIQLAGAEVELVAAMKREYKLKNALKDVRKNFDFVIIDCPPALGLLTINALTASDEVLIPIQCEYYALEGLGQLINTINLIKDNLNEFLEITGVVMTMFDQRTKLSEQVIEEVKAYFPDKVYETIIPRNVRLSEAPSYGKPINEYDPLCKGAIAYKNLTEEVIKNGAK